MKYFIAVEGVTLDDVRPGSTSSNPITFTEIFREEFLRDDLELIFLPGTYRFEERFDTSDYNNILIYGDGAVTIDGRGIYSPMKVGSYTTVAGIRFKDCLIPVEVASGATSVLLASCCDYVYENVPEDGQSFTAGDGTDIVFKNLTTYRDGIGIVIQKNTTIRNCVAVSRDSGLRPAFSGTIIDKFEDPSPWVCRTSGISMVKGLYSASCFLKPESIRFYLTNDTGGDIQASVYRNVASINSLDLSAVDRAILHVFVADASGLVSAADAFVVEISSPAGTYTYEFADTAIVECMNSLELDLTSPDSSSGIIDLADITQITLKPTLVGSGTFDMSPDYISLLDSTVDADYNVTEIFGIGDPMSAFRGGNGFDVDTYPVPFQGVTVERFQYASNSDHFIRYMTYGEGGFPMGGIFNGHHFITYEDPGHLNFTTHPIMGGWENDNTFFDSESGLPLADGLGLSYPIDESAMTIAALNGETNLVGSNSDLSRDVDDGGAQEFDVLAGVLTEAGTSWTPASPYDGTVEGADNMVVEFYCPAGGKAIMDAAGIELRLTSAGGYIYSRLALTEIVEEAYNQLQVVYASPDVSSGSFDPTAITLIEAKAIVDAAGADEGYAFDHLFHVLEPGIPAGASMDIGSGLAIDLNTYPEAQVSRIMNRPVFCRNVTKFLQAIWAASESADLGGFVNKIDVPQQLITRTIEIRYSDIRFTRYGALVGSVKKDWTVLSRSTVASAPTRDIWVHVRMTLRNRFTLGNRVV